MKQKRAMRFTLQIFSALIFLLLGAAVLRAAGPETKYPPYPDKWLFEIDFEKFYNHYSCVKAVRMENGDILMMYDKYRGKLLFEGREFEIDPENYEDFCRKYKKRTIWYLFGAELSDGTPIYKSGSSNRCYDLNPYAIKFKGTGKYFWIIQKLVKPRILYDFNRVCDRTAIIKKPYLAERFDTPTCDIITLDDNTFLCFLSIYKKDGGYKGRYIVRFDKNMNTKSDIFRQGEYYLFEIYEFIDWEEKHGVDSGSILFYSVQTRIDNIMQYIKTLK